jgi:A/G-specific adenine glycosylase
MSKAIKPNQLASNQAPSRSNLNFALTLCHWQKEHGRHDLPWQRDLTPYPVWLSEIMLQQTQVKTVLDYFERFLKRFPRVQDLALAKEDEVLSMWSGLGYYSRARNLHSCARAVVSKHGGLFPQSIEELKSLPGIGPSTAAAIASICFSSKVAIFDGNVKRVLSRYLGFQEDLSVGAHSRELALRAHALLPKKKSLMPTYTQAIMDLGATVCQPKKPLCEQCPVRRGCVGLLSGEPLSFPVQSKKIKRTQRRLFWLIAQDNQGRVLGVKREGAEHSGIWRGLYAFPEFESEINLRKSLPKGLTLQALEPIRHELTHQSLVIEPFLLRTVTRPRVSQLQLQLESLGQWMDRGRWSEVGVPRPVEACLVDLFGSNSKS